MAEIIGPPAHHAHRRQVLLEGIANSTILQGIPFQ